MRSRFLTALTLTAVVATGAAAAAVNTQVLWPSQDTVTLASDTQPADTQVPAADETPIPTATQAAQITSEVKATAHKTRVHRAATTDTTVSDDDADDDSQDAPDVEVEDHSTDDGAVEVETD